MRQPGNSQVLAFLSFIGCSAPSSLPHHILQLNVKFICPLSTPPPPKVADYKKIFDKFDVDSGGTIDAQELGTLIRGLGWENLDSVLSKFILSISKTFHDFLMQTEPVRCRGWSDPERNRCGWKWGNWLWRISLNNEVRSTEAGQPADQPWSEPFFLKSVYFEEESKGPSKKIDYITALRMNPAFIGFIHFRYAYLMPHLYLFL